MVKMPRKRTIGFMRSCQHIENETAAGEGEVGGGGVNENRMSNIILSPSTFYFAPTPLKLLLQYMIVSVYGGDLNLTILFGT